MPEHLQPPQVATSGRRALGDRADVHAATLRRIGAGDRTPVVRPARPPASAAIQPTSTWTVRVHPRVWSLALTLAGGDVRRLVVASPTEVYVDLPRELANRIREQRTQQTTPKEAAW